MTPKKSSFVDDKKCNGVIVPIYFPDDDVPQFIMFRAAIGKKVGQIEFLGGSREEYDETAIDTAIREAYEESCGMLKFSKQDLLQSPVRKVWSSFIFYVKVKNISDIDFQNHINLFKKTQTDEPGAIHFLEMDKLVKVPITEFIDKKGNPIYPNKKMVYKVTDTQGSEYVVWQLSMLAIFHAMNHKRKLINRVERGTIKISETECIFDDDSGSY